MDLIIDKFQTRPQNILHEVLLGGVMVDETLPKNRAQLRHDEIKKDPKTADKTQLTTIKVLKYSSFCTISA